MIRRSSYRAENPRPAFRQQLEPRLVGSATLLVARYLLRGGVRAGWRVVAPILAAACAAGGFLGPGFLADLGRTLFPAGAGPAAGPVAVALSLIALARALQARLRAGDRHLSALPIGSTRLQRGRVAAVAIAVAPLALALLALFLLTRDSATDEASACLERPRHAGLTVAGLLCAPLGAAVATSPRHGRRLPWMARVLTGGAGTFACLFGDARAGLGGLAAIVVALALPVGLPGPHLRRARSRDGRPAPRLPLAWLRAWRSIGVRRALATYAGSALCLAAALAFTRNNELAAGLDAAAWRLGAALGLVLVVGAQARLLQERRPPWAWARSLPNSARRRVATDALWLAAAGAPVLLAFAFVQPLAALAAAALLPHLALRAAAVACAREERWAGAAAAAFALEGAILAGAAALLWWIPLSTWLLLPAAWSGSAERDRASRAGRYSELHASDLGSSAA
jgi:hypothetical protein